MLIQQLFQVPTSLSKKQQKIQDRKSKKQIGETEYFFKTTGKNKFYSDGFLLGHNSETEKGGFTVYKNGEFLFSTEIKSLTYPVLTNNEAELAGLCYAIEMAEEGDEIIVDSMIALTWLRKLKPKARPDLEYICTPYMEMLIEKKLNVYWRPREENLAGHHNENIHKS